MENSYTVRRCQHAGGIRIRNSALGFFSWNCGGLTQLLFAEIQLNLRQHPEIQILILQETHRAHLQEWREGGWTCVNSPCDKRRSGGILLGIKEDFCERDTLRWQEIIPGRLRLHRGSILTS